MDTEEKIRQKEAQRRKNETPTVANGDEGGDGGDGDEDVDEDVETGSGMIPTPSVSRKQMVVAGVVLAVIVAVYLRSRTSSSGGNLDEAREDDWEAGEATVDDEEDGQIEVPVDHNDPLAGDEVVTEEFRKRGIIGED